MLCLLDFIDFIDFIVLLLHTLICHGRNDRAVCVTHRLNYDVLDLETKDDRPDQTEDQSLIPVQDIFCSDALQTNLKQIAK